MFTRRIFFGVFSVAVLGVTSLCSAETAKKQTRQPAFSARLIEAREIKADYTDAIHIVVDVTNNEVRDALIINAHVKIVDRLGNLLLQVKWKNNRGIAAGKTRRMSGDFSSFGGDGINTLAEIDKSLVQAEFHISKIAWKDGEVTEYDSCDLCQLLE